MCATVCHCKCVWGGGHEDPLHIPFQLWNFNIAVCYLSFALGGGVSVCKYLCVWERAQLLVLG